MDFEKMLTFAMQNLSEYFMVFASAITKPVTRFRPIFPIQTTDKPAIITNQPVTTGPQLNPKLFGFTVISIFLGVTINALIPGRKPGPDFAVTSVTVAALWLFYSTILHWACKLLGGRGTYLETLSVSLQLISVLYVLSSLISLLLSAIFNVPQIHAAASRDGGIVGFAVRRPVSFYFLSNALLLIVYLPIAIRHVHQFSWAKQLIVAIIPVFSVLFSIAFYLSFGVLQAPPR